MADGDSEIVFGKGRPVPQPETVGGVNLFAHSNADEITNLGEAINETPLQGSTPVVMHLQEAGDNGQAQEDPETEIRTFHPSKLPKMVVRPETYEGRGDWAEYLSHFNDCAELGGWTDQERCLVLAANLRAAARKYYTGLSSEEKQDYTRLIAALKCRFGGEHRQDAWLSNLEMRKRRPGESISEIGDHIWQMTQRAYHDFDHRSQEQLALKQFYRIIDADMKVKCFENKCSNILDAVNVVERYEALYDDKKDSKRTTVRAMESRPDTAVAAMEQILEQLERLEARQTQCEDQLLNQPKAGPRNPKNNDYRRSKSNVTCYGCGEKGHYMSNCPQNPKNNYGNRQTSWGNDRPSNWRAEVWWVQKGLKTYTMENNHQCLRIIIVQLSLIQQLCLQTGNHLPVLKILIPGSYMTTMTLDLMLLNPAKNPAPGKIGYLPKDK